MNKQKGEALVIICFIVALTGVFWMPGIDSSGPMHDPSTLTKDEIKQRSK